MAKSVKIEVDVSTGTLEIADGALFLGDRVPIVFKGYTPDTGNTLRLTIFAKDGVTPLADNHTNAAVLDLGYAKLRDAFGGVKIPSAVAGQFKYEEENRCELQFAASVIELNTSGASVGVLAQGFLPIVWSPYVIDSVSGAPATLKGDAGADGADGEDGADGVNGINGTNGTDGAQGAQGIQGIQGVKGDKGDKGDTGAQGAKGDKGDKGDTGAQGEKGDKGDQGDRGIQGVQGIQGLQGIQGEKGDKGDDGDVSQVLTGETIVASPTQKQMATALKSIWVKLGGTIAMLTIAFSVYADVTRSTQWQEVPPETTVGTVADLADMSGKADTAFVTNKVAEAIRHTDEATNAVSQAIANKADAGAIDSMIADVNRDIATKQDKLVSGTNIKTINGQSILGSGNIRISGGGGGGGISADEAGEIATNVVRDLSLGGIWDTQLQVWWTPRMINGSLKYCATTNVNLNAGN